MPTEQRNPQEVLASLSELIAQKRITKDEVLNLFPAELEKSVAKPKTKFNIQQIMYYVGALIVLMGIVFFIAQFWPHMGQIAKVLMTIVPASSAYLLGYYFYCTKDNKEFGHAFFVISAAIFPLAIGTTLDLASISATKVEGGVVNFAVLFMIFALSYSYTKALIFLPFAVATGTGLFFTTTNYLLRFTAAPPHFAEYQLITTGITYLLLGYYYKNLSLITNLLYLFGTSAILGPTLALTGFNPKINIFWQLVYPFLLGAIYYLSIKLQNKTILIMVTLFTFGEILKLTAEYFSKSIGWPISLVISGLIIMSMGYMSIEINKKFLHKA